MRRGLNASPMLVFAAFCVYGMWALIEEDESGTMILLIGILTGVFVFAAVGLFMSHRFIHRASRPMRSGSSAVCAGLAEASPACGPIRTGA